MNGHPFQPTPEPWVIESCPANAPATLIIGNPTEGQSVAIVTGDPNQPHVQSNARLIIASPRMLRTLRKMLLHYRTLARITTGSNQTPTIDEAEELIRELEGGAR